MVKWNGQPVNINVKHEAIPSHRKVYRITHAYQKIEKKEIARLEKLGFFKRCEVKPELAPPCYTIPKKIGKSY